MNILAIDCCTKLTGVALNKDFEQLNLGRSQSQELPKMTENILFRNNLKWQDLDYIALTNGPGYFTGIRVGAAYAMGLAYSCEIKIIPVSTLDLLAYGSNNKTLALIYSGHGFVYAKCKNYLDSGEYSHEFITSWLNENPDADIISDEPERINMPDINILKVDPNLLSLIEIAKLGIENAVSPNELKILYFRAPQGMY